MITSQPARACGAATRADALLRVISPLALVFVASGCGSTAHSSYLETGGFEVTYAIVREGTAPTRAFARFRDRGPDGPYLELDGGDAIAVDRIPLVRIDSSTPDAARDAAFPDGAMLVYGSQLTVAGDHAFVLSRPAEEPIPQRIADPPAFAVSFGGASSLSATYADAPTLTWSAVPGGKVSVSAASTAGDACGSPTLATDVDDGGRFVIDSSKLQPSDAGASCSFHVTVVRRTKETIGGPFHGGELRAVSIATVELTLR